MFWNKHLLALLHLLNKQLFGQLYLLKCYLNVSQIAIIGQAARCQTLHELYLLQHFIDLAGTIATCAGGTTAGLRIHPGLSNLEVLKERSALAVTIDTQTEFVGHSVRLSRILHRCQLLGRTTDTLSLLTFIHAEGSWSEQVLRRWLVVGIDNQLL